MLPFLETLRLIRIFNCLLAFTGVAVGAWMTWLQAAYYRPLVAAMAALCLCAAGNIVNDLVDIDIDRINRPHRVLVRGALRRNFAIFLAVLFNVGGLLLALAVSWQVTVLAGFVIVLLLAYNLRLKSIPLLGNTVIALLGAATFMTGGIAVDHVMALSLPGPLVPAVFAFFFHMVREIVKDVQDIEGDRQVGTKTWPQVVGIRNALTLALALFLVLVLLTYVPVLAGWFGPWYKIITVYIVDLPLLLLLILLWGNPTPAMLRVTSLGLKVGMGLGLVALLAAEVLKK